MAKRSNPVELQPSLENAVSPTAGDRFQAIDDERHIGGEIFARLVVRARLLRPLGMNMTGITLSDSMSTFLVKGHDLGGDVVPLWDLPTLAGAGALRSNMRDMLVFLDANLGAPASDLERAMRTSHESRASDGSISFGLNWVIRAVGEDRILWHNGGTAGYRTFIGFDPDKQVGAVVLTNSAHGADDIGFHLVNNDVPLSPPTVPEPRTAIEVPVDVMEDYVGEYQLAPQFSIAVTLEDSSLFVQATGQPRFPIYAESETEFFLKVVDAQITFVRDDSGSVTQLILHQSGRDVSGRKVR